MHITLKYWNRERTIKFRLLNSSLTVGNSKSWPRGLNLMAPGGLSLVVYKWLRQCALWRLWRKRSCWELSAKVSKLSVRSLITIIYIFYYFLLLHHHHHHYNQLQRQLVESVQSKTSNRIRVSNISRFWSSNFRKLSHSCSVDRSQAP